MIRVGGISGEMRERRSGAIRGGFGEGGAGAQFESEAFL